MHPTLYTNRTIARRVVRARDVRLILAVTMAGSVAAVLANPMFWLSTAALVALLAVVQRRTGEVDVRDDRRLQSLPLPLQRTLRSTLAGLPPGDAKRLLNAVGRQAAILFDARRSVFDEPWGSSARQNVSDLVEAACEVAQELSRLDRAVSAHDSQAPDEKLGAKLVNSRRLFAGRLEDAAAALASLYASGVHHGTPASDRVAELVQEIRADAAATSHAWSEVQKLADVHSAVP
jgi:hypothetical protein